MRNFILNFRFNYFITAVHLASLMTIPCSWQSKLHFFCSCHLTE